MVILQILLMGVEPSGKGSQNLRVREAGIDRVRVLGMNRLEDPRKKGIQRMDGSGSFQFSFPEHQQDKATIQILGFGSSILRQTQIKIWESDGIELYTWLLYFRFSCDLACRGYPQRNTTPQGGVSSFMRILWGGIWRQPV